MNLAPLRRLTCRCTLALAVGAGAAAAAEPPPLPAWQSLEFEQKAFWVTASSRVALDAATDGHWRLTAANSVASNTEELTLELCPVDGRSLERTSLSQGRKSQRLKRWQFLPSHILRQRREPGADAGLPPAEWPLTSSREIPYPEAAQDPAVADPYALLILAQRLAASGATSAQALVNTDFNFYRVTLARADGPAVEAAYRVLPEGGTVTGVRDTVAVTLQAAPVGSVHGEPDFSLLGLSGEITLLLDRESGLPLQVRGIAPRLGEAHIDLRAVTPRRSAE